MKNFTSATLNALFDGRSVSPLLPYEDLGTGTDTLALIREGNGRLSISGAQEKYAFVEDKGILRLTQPGEQGRYIAKPVPVDRRFFFKEDMPANECLTMTIAQKVFGMEVAAHGLCYLGNGQPVYITRRFDFKPDGTKYAMEDLASVAGLGNTRFGSDYKYRALSYEECADLIKKYCSSPSADLLKFYKLIVFNYLFSNADAHLKNFSLIGTAPGEYHLAPAYDLLNTELHIDTPIFALEKGLFREGRPIIDTTPIGRPMLTEFGTRIGFSEKTVQRILARFSKRNDKIEELISRSALSDLAKNDYLQQFHYRKSTLQ